MIKLVASEDTFLKKALKQSSKLKKGQKHPVPRSKSIHVKSISPLIGNTTHSEVVLEYGAGTWYVFNKHFGIGEKATPKNQIVRSFKNGVPKPVIVNNPNKTQVIEAIVNYCGRVKVTRLKHIAYILATAEGESQFKPVREYRGKYLTKDQKKYWYTNFMGRGFIQVTWKSNYVKVGNKLGEDLVSNPGLLLTYPFAIASLVLGMRDGWYTKKRLTSYQYGDYAQYRRIVNPGEVIYAPRNAHYRKRWNYFTNAAHKWEKYLTNFRYLYPFIVD